MNSGLETSANRNNIQCQTQTWIRGLRVQCCTDQSCTFFLFPLKPFNNWLEGAREDLMDMFSVHTVEEIVV